MFRFAAFFTFARLLHCLISAAVISWLLVLISAFMVGTEAPILLIMSGETLVQDLNFGNNLVHCCHRFGLGWNSMDIHLLHYLGV